MNHYQPETHQPGDVIPNLMSVNARRYIWGTQQTWDGRRSSTEDLAPRQRMFAEFSVFRREPRSISKYHSRLDSLRYHQILGRRIKLLYTVQQSKGPGDCACAFYGVLKQLQTDHVACSLLASHPRWVAAVGLPGSPGEQRISSASGLSRGGSLPGGLPPGCASQGTWGCGVSDDVMSDVISF